jgi:hypothetical protein
MDANYVGICDVIDWSELILSLESQMPAYVGPRHRVGDPAPGIDDLGAMWIAAGHKTVEEGGSARWDMFLPKVNFDEEIAFKFARWVGLDDYTNCWISRILPGHMAPWHWDVTDDENTLKNKEHDRYHCHIGEPDPAHVLIVEGQCLHNQKQGSVYKWPSRQSWHCGLNGGMKPKYLFNFWH